MITDLIAEVTNAVRNSFYADRPVHHFKRDERAIMRAIARYGAECDRRGWNFQVDFIRRDLIGLLRSIREKNADIKYLPVYLEGAVDRHIRMRAEDLNAAAKHLPNIVQRSTKDIVTTAALERSPVETLALLYKDLKKRQVRRAPVAAKVVKERQGSFL